MKLVGGGLTIDLKGHHICQGVTDFVRRWGRDIIGQQIEGIYSFPWVHSISPPC